MKPEVRVVVVVILVLSVASIVTAGISWDAYVKKEHAKPAVDAICLFSAFCSALSILPLLIWSVWLAVKKRWKDTAAVFSAFAIALLAFQVCDSSWPILR